MHQLYRDWPKLFLIIALANFALSAWSISLDSVINNDGITYLAMAELFINGDWSTAYSYYSWPFYPLLIAGVAKAFFVDVTMAAHILNTLLATSLCLAFVCIADLLSSGNRRVILIAAVIILFFPSITKYRAFIIRDFGYLSFYLWSLYFIFRFCGSLNKKDFIAWFLTAALSCLFRFEGILLLLVVPYFLFACAAQKVPYRKAMLACLTASLAVLFAVLIWWYLEDKYSASIEVAQANGENIRSLVDMLWHNISQQFNGNETGFIASLKVIASNTGEVTYELIRRMAIFYFFIAVVAYWKGLGLTSKLVKSLWLLCLVTNFITLIGFSFINNLIVSRYTMATALTLLILVPFALNRLLDYVKHASIVGRSLSYLLLLLITIASAEGLNVSTNKTHFLTAGKWMQNHFPEEATLYSNDRLLVHYAQLGAKHNFVDQFSNQQMWVHLEQRSIKAYDFVALSITPNSGFEDILRQTLSFHFGLPIKIIKGQDERSVFIFSTQKSDSDN